MLLSQTAEYALRAMAWLATRGEGEALTAKDLSAATDIPSHYLSKILRRLVIDGLLRSQRGHGGGFSLARPPEDIRFLDVLAALDVDVTPGRCAFGWGACDMQTPCPLHEAWESLSDEIHQWARTTTLADVNAIAADDMKRRLGYL